MRMIGWDLVEPGIRIESSHEPGWHLQMARLGKMKIHFVQNLGDSYAPEMSDYSRG